MLESETLSRAERDEPPSGASRRFSGSGAAATAPPLCFALARFGGLFTSGPALAAANSADCGAGPLAAQPGPLPVVRSR
jgi:hypothetical protein